MDEKILIKSEMDKKARKIFLALIGGFFSLFAILIFSLLVKTEKTEREYLRYSKTWIDVTYESNGFEEAFERGNDTAFILFIIACSCLLLGLVTLIVFLIHRKCEITVTEKNVRGKTLFGKEVVLPIYMISAYSTRSFMSIIAVATSSGLTKFALIGNYKEIGNVLSKMINDRQENTAKQEMKAESSNSSMDDLVKLKTLLDQGIITQEEFEAKKKQLLGL